MPCVDAVLYTPVYLAILYLTRKGAGYRIQFDQTGHEVYREWVLLDKSLTIRLYNPGEGDKKNTARVATQGPTDGLEEVTIGVGDPMTAIKHPFPSEDHEITLMGTFINRIALWALVRRHSKARTNEAKKKHEVFGEINWMCTDGVPPLYPNGGQFKTLSLGYSKKGETTSTVVGRLIEGAFDEKTYVEGLGWEEVRGVIERDYDVTFTFAPWLLQGWGESNPQRAAEVAEIKTFAWFRGVPFPFSSMFTCIPKETLRDAQNPKTKLIKHFVWAVYIGLGLLQRYRSEGILWLLQNASRFRFFGFPPMQDSLHKVIKLGVGHLFKADCLNEALDNSKIAWTLALDIHNENPDNRMDILGKLSTMDDDLTACVRSSHFWINQFEHGLEEMRRLKTFQTGVS